MVRRSGTESSADLFLEPPPGDCFEKDFTINVIYEDGQNANANVKADEHTEPNLAVDPKAPAVPPLDAWVHLTGDEQLFGNVRGDRPRTPCSSRRPGRTSSTIPLARVVGVHFGLLERKESPESFAKRLKSRGAGRPAPGPDQERRGRGHPGRRRRHRGRQAALPLPGQDPDAAAEAWSRAWSWPRGRSPSSPTRCGRPSRWPAAWSSRAVEGPRHQRLEDRDRLGPGSEAPGRRRPATSGSAAGR